MRQWTGRALRLHAPRWPHGTSSMDGWLVLLSYKLRRPRCTAAPPQHGQRGKRVTIAAMSLRRMVAIEFGMCRSGRKGGSSGSVTVGYGKLREQSGGGGQRGGGVDLFCGEGASTRG